MNGNGDEDKIKNEEERVVSQLPSGMSLLICDAQKNKLGRIDIWSGTSTRETWLLQGSIVPQSTNINKPTREFGTQSLKARAEHMNMASSSVSRTSTRSCPVPGPDLEEDLRLSKYDRVE